MIELEIGNKLVRAIQELHFSFRKQEWFSTSRHLNNDDLLIAMPLFLIELVRIALIDKHQINFSKDDIEYNGIKIIPNHEMSIVIYSKHIDQKNAPIRKLLIFSQEFSKTFGSATIYDFNDYLSDKGIKLQIQSLN